MGNESTYDPTTGRYTQRAVPGESGTSLTTIAVSTDESDWVNDGSWVFNGDGTVTTTGTGGAALFHLPASAVGYCFALDLTVPLEVLGDGDVYVNLQGLDGGLQSGIEWEPDSGDLDMKVASLGANGWRGVSLGAAPVGSHLYRAVIQPVAARLLLDGVVQFFASPPPNASAADVGVDLYLYDEAASVSATIDLAGIVLKVATV